MNELVWSKEKPTAPGWYWHRDGRVSPVEVDREDDGKLYVWVNALEVPVALIKGEWSGPIPIPIPREAT